MELFFYNYNSTSQQNDIRTYAITQDDVSLLEAMDVSVAGDTSAGDTLDEDKLLQEEKTGSSTSSECSITGVRQRGAFKLRGATDESSDFITPKKSRIFPTPPSRLRMYLVV